MVRWGGGERNLYINPFILSAIAPVAFRVSFMVENISSLLWTPNVVRVISVYNCATAFLAFCLFVCFLLSFTLPLQRMDQGS